MKKTKKLAPNRRLVYAIVALLGSLALWVYVRTAVNPYSDPWVYRVPVVFEGVDALTDRSLILLAGENATVDLHLYGKLRDTATLNRSNITLTVDVSTIRAAGEYSLDYDIAFPDSIADNSVTVLERSPSSVQLTVGKVKTKRIEVAGSGGSPAEGYLAETMVCNPDTIQVSGPEELVDQVDHAEVYLDRDNLERTVNTVLDFTLVDADGNPVEDDRLQCDVDQIEVELPILATKEVKLTVELLAGSGATDADATCTIKPESIRIAGDAELLKGVNQISLGSIDLGEVYGQATLKRSIVIPNDMQNLSGEEEASITVELKGLDTRTIRTSNIELINKPHEDTQEYTVISSSLSVVVRGKSAVVEEIYPTNLRVVADLSEYDEPGQYKVPVSVYVDGYADVGILHEGDYAIVVSITQKQRGSMEGS